MDEKRFMQIGGVFLTLGIVLGMLVAWYLKSHTEANLLENWELAKQSHAVAKTLTPFAGVSGSLGLLLVLFGTYRSRAKVRNY